MKKACGIRAQITLLIAVAAALIALMQVYYYSGFYQMMEEREDRYRMESIRQMEANLLTIQQGILATADTVSFSRQTQEYLRDKSVASQFGNYEKVRDLLLSVKSANRNIAAVMLLDLDGRVSGQYGAGDLRVMRRIGRQFDFTYRSAQRAGYYAIADEDEENGFAYAYVQPIQRALAEDESSQAAGTCIILLNLQNIDRIMTSISPVTGACLLFLDRENRVISSNRQEMGGAFFDLEGYAAQARKSGGSTVDFSGEPCFFQYQDVEETGWKIVSILPEKEVTGSLKKVRATGALLGGATVAFLILWGYRLVRGIGIPIQQMAQVMQRVGDGDGAARMYVSVHNELEMLGDGVNRMLDRIEEGSRRLIEANTRLYEEKLLKKQAQINALQSQINPHFLYNTLNCISGIASEYQADPIIDVASALSMILRYSIKEPGMVPVSDEMRCVDSYLKIIRIRYPERFQYDIRVDEEIWGCSIPKLTLQPLIENAVYHGLEKRPHGGILTVKGFIGSEGDICFEVKDNGAGISPGDLRRIRALLHRGREREVCFSEKDKRCIGLINIDRRLQMVFGESYGIRLESSCQEGTTVAFSFPGEAFKKSEEKEGGGSGCWGRE
ncbi:MAG: sensor histidine kinase [Provencibacterium sp.]|jgi:two-component system sensor histidine kinase YesM|nr:sensor histidine kinase [Provencibacterium sp.]